MDRERDRQTEGQKDRGIDRENMQRERKIDRRTERRNEHTEVLIVRERSTDGGINT
jgi:hypothetical protein